MSKLGCVCGHAIPDQSDCLPYKAYIREDEDTQKPVEILADVLARYFEARQRGPETEAEVIWQFIRSIESEADADYQVRSLTGKPLREVLFTLIFPLWNNYDRVNYECEQCGRLKVQVQGNRFVSYLPETDRRHVLWSRHNHNPYGHLDDEGHIK